jgi:hypothetical protein
MATATAAQAQSFAAKKGKKKLREVFGQHIPVAIGLYEISLAG